MERSEVISLCRKWIGAEASALSADDKALIAYLYREIVGKPIKNCRCKNKYSDALTEIYRRIKTEERNMARSKYELKAGVIIMLKGDTTPYTNDNLTDKVAKQFLKEHPAAVGRFAVIPSEEDAPKVKKTRKAKAK